MVRRGVFLAAEIVVEMGPPVPRVDPQRGPRKVRVYGAAHGRVDAREAYGPNGGRMVRRDVLLAAEVIVEVGPPVARVAPRGGPLKVRVHGAAQTERDGEIVVELAPGKHTVRTEVAW